ncbi:MAG: hypothetical protein NWT12_01190 [Paracoccaceae bacterium]|nr:hypothetical protein [Paracoccaceae bacterium]
MGRISSGCRILPLIVLSLKETSHQNDRSKDKTIRTNFGGGKSARCRLSLQDRLG